MARYKHYDRKQTKLIPIDFDSQIVPGTFEHTLCYLIDHEFDLTGFESRYRNDETGAPAYDPSILLKVILYAYSRGITSSREIARACRENVMFMALSGDSQPHFTTIASFISGLGEEATRLFRDVLLVCDAQGLIGREMFAVDGVKLPSNASKEWSGTRKDFERKVEKMERAVRHLVSKHRAEDEAAQGGGDEGKGGGGSREERERRRLERLQAKVRKLKGWLAEREDKVGRSGKPIKSNLTDNDSAKMSSAHGVIQGYDAVSMVDGKHQVIVHARAFGVAQEQELLVPMVEGTREAFQALGDEADVYEGACVLADSGFHSESNVRYLFESGIDAYLADHLFRKRDSRFEQAKRHDPGRPVWGSYRKESKRLTPQDFDYDEARGTCICPAGKRLYRHGSRCIIGGREAVRFQGSKSACGSCELRERCLRYPERTLTRQVAFFKGRVATVPETYTERMKRKIDSELGRLRYGLRLAIAEPPFANIRSTLGLDRFTLRGKRKVNGQWLLFCAVHNIGKVHRYGYGFT